jgi:hypothetical protein
MDFGSPKLVDSGVWGTKKAPVGHSQWYPLREGVGVYGDFNGNGFFSTAFDPEFYPPFLIGEYRVFAKGVFFV